jgi:7-cyano-7-deazaguanine synthase in queuosine biosynthesis
MSPLTSAPEAPVGNVAHLWLQEPGEKRRPPRQVDTVVWLGEAGGPGRVLHHQFSRFFPLPPPRREAVLGFLLAALGLWAADKLVPRRDQPDAWSRTIYLHLPLPPAWAVLAPRLEALAGFLTGDVWNMAARPPAGSSWFAAARPTPWTPDAVVLFSGGLDSLIGALDLLEEGERLVLVSHYDYGQLAATQHTLAAALRDRYGPDRVHHLSLPVQLEGPELTLRSRSLLYLALGLAAAAAFPGPPPLIIPENGWISLNPPLTLNRLGTLSTRTTHPKVLQEVAALWRDGGLPQDLRNPYQRLTKGEMVRHCRNHQLLGELAPLTVSCARPVAGRWQRETQQACGYCYPCLVRRAALHCLSADRGRDYRVDVLADPKLVRHRVQGRTLRALLLALQTWKENPEEMTDRVGPGDGAGEGALPEWAMRLLAAGFGEFDDWLKTKGERVLQEFSA